MSCDLLMCFITCSSLSQYAKLHYTRMENSMFFAQNTTLLTIGQLDKGETESR